MHKINGHLLSHKQQVSFYYFIQEVNRMEMILFTAGFAVTLAAVKDAGQAKSRWYESVCCKAVLSGKRA